jgi:cytochrome b involved in lipid metabolism
VYDLTAWISKHPGGERAILSICGKDGSAAFNDQHGGQRRPANELSGFKIGTIATP